MRRKNKVDCTSALTRSTSVVIDGNDDEDCGCREYVNCTVEGEERCSVRDMFAIESSFRVDHCQNFEIAELPQYGTAS